MPDRDPGEWNVPPAAGGGIPVVAIVPQMQKQGTLANLGIAGTFDMDFNIDYTPILDVMLFADRAIDIELWLRQSDADTFRRLDDAVFASGTANILRQPIRGLRVAASMLRVRFVNNSGVATTILSAQAHVRSA